MLFKETRRLMIVDDEAKICSALRFSLRSEGYQLRFANSAQEALVRLREESADVVLSDRLMPKHDWTHLPETAARSLSRYRLRMSIAPF